MSVPLFRAVDVSKRFARTPDLAERTAIAMGAMKPPATVHALDGVNLTVAKGEVVGLAGESGCGKSTLGRVLAGLMPPSDGRVEWMGKSITQLSQAETRRMRLATQIIFQDPMSSLNPRLRVQDIIGEAPVFHGLVKRRHLRDRVAELLHLVGLDPDHASRYPHQFSGGQRQRIGIARALAVNPDLLICDESIAALDVSIQAQMLNLFMRLRRELDLTVVFISHDLSVIRHISDRVVVMYLGRVVEQAETEILFGAPAHPYTRALLDEVAHIDRRRRRFAPVEGEIPSPVAPPPGCHFNPRCRRAQPRCAAEVPALREIAAGRRAACHFAEDQLKETVPEQGEEPCVSTS